MANFHRFCSSLSVNQLAWRPLRFNVDGYHEAQEALLLAVASEDSSLGIWSLKFQI